MGQPATTSGWSALRSVVVTLTAALSLLLLVPVTIWLLRDGSNMPLCNKETLFDVMNWLDKKERTALPNVDGHSIDSMAQLKQYDCESADGKEYLAQWNEKYQYIPGLQRGDPNDLVVMYLKHATRWQNHATGTPSVFSTPKWVLVPLDFLGAGSSFCAEHRQRKVSDESECAERVSLDELKSRLRKTLDYLKNNDRPNWQNVVAENEAFLNSTEK